MNRLLQLADGRRATALAYYVFLAAASALACVFATHNKAAAQSMMVGADGAIHLDPSLEVNANSPVIIQQTPELIQPSFSEPGLPGAMPLQGPIIQGPLQSPLMSGDAYGACVPFVPCTPVVAQSAQPRPPLPIAFALFGEFFYLQPHDDLVHAQQANALGVPAGGLAVNDFDYEPGFRVGGDIAVSPTNSIAASGSWFEADASSSLSAPPLGSVLSLVQTPSAGALTSVTSTSDISFYTAEAEYRSRLLQGPRHWVNGGLGLRYAHLEQEFTQRGASAILLPGNVLAVDTDIEFDGGGPRLTLDGGRLLGNRGLSVYARSSVSPLIGRFHADYRFRNETLGADVAHVHYDDDRIMTLFDYEVGLAWTGPRKRWRFAAGYLQSFWFNAVTTSEFIPAVQSANFSDVSDTLMFDGLTARVEHFW